MAFASSMLVLIFFSVSTIYTKKMCELAIAAILLIGILLKIGNFIKNSYWARIYSPGNLPEN
jgi:prolipoprotein diacylglyceryltransferase